MVGRKIWAERQKAVRLILESKKAVSVLDKAFTILAWENYWACWHEGATAMWTDSRQGNYQYMGWADVAYTRFDQLCTPLRVQRQMEINKELESLLGMGQGQAGRWRCTYGAANWTGCKGRGSLQQIGR
jgi:hypothetical protein